jgi:1,4-alpha-glucan branching enzyme
MERCCGLWTLTVRNAKKGDRYKYLIEGQDGSLNLKADPYSVKNELPPGAASIVWEIDDTDEDPRHPGPDEKGRHCGLDPQSYQWTDSKWMQDRAKKDILKSPLSIYEMHFASWRREGEEETDYPSFRETAPELAAYLKEHGFTHVELLPILDFPFDGSWGYQTTGFFAITSRFGTPADFKYFVDTLHGAGIGVIADWAGGGFPKDAHSLAKFDGSWLYEHEHPLRREHPHWGTNSFNFGRPEVKSFLTSSANMLMREFHLDGLRVDAVSSMLYLDYGRDEFIPNKDGGNVD